MLAGRRNGFLPLVMVDYFYALADDWSPPEDGSTSVIARLRNQAPLVVEQRFRQGARRRPAHAAVVRRYAAWAAGPIGVSIRRFPCWRTSW